MTDLKQFSYQLGFVAIAMAVCFGLGLAMYPVIFPSVPRVVITERYIKGDTVIVRDTVARVVQRVEVVHDTITIGGSTLYDVPIASTEAIMNQDSTGADTVKVQYVLPPHSLFYVELHKKPYFSFVDTVKITKDSTTLINNFGFWRDAKNVGIGVGIGVVLIKVIELIKRD